MDEYSLTKDLNTLLEMNVPRGVLLTYVEQLLATIREFPENTPDRDLEIAEIEYFILCMTGIKVT